MPDDLLRLDAELLWHPYAAPGTPTRLVTGAEGVRLRFADGASAIDAMASWWCMIHGYRHPVLDAALAAQAAEFSHVMFGGLTHEPAIRLAERLVEITPEPLRTVFFCDSGSVSVEVAIKLALQYQVARGRIGRTRLLTVRGGYHGDTFEPMSVCDPVNGMHSLFTGALTEQVFGPRPPAAEAEVEAWSAQMSSLAAAHESELAAIIVEPLLQGAGGMHPYHPRCLDVLRSLADEHGLLLIFDEIATGFGRTGSLFVSLDTVAPDILCLGKALTGGYLSLAATLCTPDVAQTVSSGAGGALMHGPTFMANPLACAVALASIDLLLSGDWSSVVSGLSAGLTAGLAPAVDKPGVKDVRVLGAVGVVQLTEPVDLRRVTAVALDHGVWVRPFRDLIYTMPPYVCTDDEIARICAAIVAAA